MSTIEALSRIVESKVKRNKMLSFSTADGEFYLELVTGTFIQCLVRGQQGGWCISQIPLRDDWREVAR